MFLEYLKLGFEHILDPGGIDHVLFILVLAVPYFIKDWKRVVLLATAFTIGHSLTLAFASLNIIKVNSQIVEILIAVSILLTGIINIKDINKTEYNLKYPLALCFGLIHGLGFSNFFKSILGKDDIVLPLLAFNIGVELAQLLIIGITLILTYFLIKLIKIKHSFWIGFVSVCVIILSLKMILERI